MIERAYLNDFIDRLFEQGYIYKKDNYNYRFAEKANKITSAILNGCSWTYFKYNGIIPGQAHYWMPVKYTIRDINDKYCWKFVEESKLSEELLEKFCKFFKIDMLFDTFEIYDGPDCLEI